MKRAKLRGLKRNVAVVFGNIGTLEDESMLRQALADTESLVRKHVTWAVERIESSSSSSRSSRCSHVKHERSPDWTSRPTRDTKHP